MNIDRIERFDTSVTRKELEKIHCSLLFMLAEASFTTPTEKEEYRKIADEVEKALED